MTPRVRKLYATVGEINMYWDEIEILLWYVFDWILDTRWSFSYSIYFSHQNHRARREMLETLSQVALNPNHPQTKELNSLLGRVKRAANKRNELAHGIWHRSKVGRKVLLERIPLKRHPREAGAIRLGLKDLEQTRDQLAKLYAELYDFAGPRWDAQRNRDHDRKWNPPASPSKPPTPLPPPPPHS
jgi:hypothetical protein